MCSKSEIRSLTFSTDESGVRYVTSVVAFKFVMKIFLMFSVKIDSNSLSKYSRWFLIIRCAFSIIKRNSPPLNLDTHVHVHDDVIKWKHFPRHWPFVVGIHRSPVNSQHKGQWRGALMFSLICGWINDWVNNRGAGDLRRHRAHMTSR